jgi:uncharacterized protein
MKKLLAKVEPALARIAELLGVSEPELEPISGSVAVAQISFPGTDRLPIFVTNAGSQVLCISYLFQEKDIRPRKRMALLETLLDMNLSIPLSDFGRIGEHYVLFGSLSPASSTEDLATECATLSDNSNDALAMLQSYLKD